MGPPGRDGALAQARAEDEIKQNPGNPFHSSDSRRVLAHSTFLRPAFTGVVTPPLLRLLSAFH